MRSRYHLIYEQHVEDPETGAVRYSLRCEHENLNGDPPRVVARWELSLRPEHLRAAAWHQWRPQEIQASEVEHERLLDLQRLHESTPHDFGAYLGEHAMPDELRSELRDYLGGPDAGLELVLRVPPVLALLPWEALALARSEKKFAALVHPVLGEFTQLVRWIERGPAAKPPVPHLTRRVLLICGALDQVHRSARPDVIAVHRAIRAAGFECTLALGSAELAGIDTAGLQANVVLRSADQLVPLLARERFSIVHYIGHSNALELGLDAPEGASALVLDLVRAAKLGTETLAFSELDGKPRPIVQQLAASGVGLFVAQACRARESLARSVLAHGGATAFVGLGGMAAPELCARAAAAFYRELFATREIGEGVRAMRRAISDHPPTSALSWMPLLYANARELPRLVEEEDALIERYCAEVAEEHRCYRGRFRAFGDTLEAGFVTLAVQRDRDPGSAQQNQLHRSFFGSRGGAALPFATMLEEQEFEHGRRAWTLTGPAGAGKTTTLRMHVRALALDRRRRRIPLFVELPTWLRAAEKDSLLLDLPRYVSRNLGWSAEDQQKLAEALRAKLAEGRLILALDGYDELDPALRRVLQKVAPWSKKQLHESTLVLGTRPRLGSTDLPAELGDLVLVELELSQAQTLLQRLLEAGCIDATRAEERAAHWHTVWENGRHFWRELMSRPYAVAWLALIELKEFEERQIESRSRFLDVVLEELAKGGGAWKDEPEADPQDGTRRGLADPESALQLLGLLALGYVRAFAASLPKAEVKKILEEEDARGVLAARGESADEFLKALAERTALFGPENQKVDSSWRFLHRSLLEALAARELERRFFTGADADEQGPARLFAQLGEWKVLEGFEALDAKALAERTARLEALSQSEAGIQELYRRALDLRDERRQSRRNELYPLGIRGDRNAIRKIVVPELARVELRAERAEFWMEPLLFLAQRRMRHTELLEALWQQLPELRRSSIERLGRIELAAWRLAISAQVFPELEDRCDALEIASEKLDTADHDMAVDELCQRIETTEELTERGSLVEALLALDPTFAVQKRTRWQVLLDRHHPTPDLEQLRAALPSFPRKIQGGPYWIGTSGGGPIGREERFEVGFDQERWIADAPVTVELYRLFAPRELMWWKGAPQPLSEPSGDLPVASVSWYAARLFCHWLTRHASELLADAARDPRPLAAVLPDEALWEVAARAGSAEELEYWNGDGPGALDAIGSYRENSDDKLNPVRQKRANDWGLYDTSGNVWEWCSNAFLPSTSAALRASRRGRGRVLRGGSYWNDAVNCRSAFRFACRPSVRNGDFGFRVALAPELGGP